MTLLIIQFVALAAVIVVAGSFLARFADLIGERTGMGRSLAGLVLLATATSLPELMVSCSAGYLGAGDMAAGNLFGSSLYNLAILAVLDLSFRSRGRMLSRMAGAHALSATMSIVLTAIALLFIVVPLDWPLRVGPGSVIVVATYFMLLRLVYFDALFAAGVVDHTKKPVKSQPSQSGSLRGAIIGYLIATAVILMTGPTLAHTADDLAHRSGLSGTFVGTAFLALSTSLPELVTTTAAVRMGAFDMAVGNIFGSNSFNMTILFGIDLFYGEPLLQSVSPVHAVTATSVIIVTAVALMGLLYREKKRFWIVEPDAALILTLVAAALVLNFVLSG